MRICQPRARNRAAGGGREAARFRSDSEVAPRAWRQLVQFALLRVETRVTVRIMASTARATYVRYRTERALTGTLWSSSTRSCCPPGSAGRRDLSSLGALKDDHASFAMDGSLPRAGSQNCEGLVVKERTAHPGKFSPLGRRASLSVAPPRSATANGIEVHEETWGTVTVQHVYKMRCECGRSWFELELPRFVRCPACHQLDLVSA